MEPNSIVSEFKNALSNGDDFEIVEASEGVWELRLETCVIEFSFEPRDEGFLIAFKEPGAASSASMSFWVLRHLRGAYDPGHTRDTPAYYASVTDRFFADLLQGDFSIRAQYTRLRSSIVLKRMQLERLPESHPARIKFKQFDIRWMDEV